MKNLKTRFLAVLGMTIGVLFVSLVWAGEIRQSIGDEAFVSKAEQSQEEIFKFDLPEIPKGSRIDFAGLVFHIQRDSVRDEYLSLKLVPITSDWTPTSVKNGQVLSVDEEAPAYAVVDVNRDDKAELDITPLVAAWLTGEKTNRGFLLQTELPEDETKFSVQSNAGIKAELVIYYTGPEK